MSTCIFPGRFEPFHEGHLMVVQGMIKAFGNATIVICDSNKKDEAHPFSIAERHEMISSALLAVDILDATIVDVKDGPSDEAWAQDVLNAAGNPAEPVIWSGNEEVRKIFEAKGVATKKIVPVPGVDSATIRDLIAKKDPSWRAKIPAGAVDVMMSIIDKREQM